MNAAILQALQTTTLEIEAKSVAQLFPDTPSKLSNGELVIIAVSTFQKMRDAFPYLLELRSRFENAPRDKANRLKESIGGCNSWSEFCELHLHRTTSAVRKLLGEENPASTGARAAASAPTTEDTKVAAATPTTRLVRVSEEELEDKSQPITPQTAVPELLRYLKSLTLEMSDADKLITYESVKVQMDKLLEKMAVMA